MPRAERGGLPGDSFAASSAASAAGSSVMGRMMSDAALRVREHRDAEAAVSGSIRELRQSGGVLKQVCVSRGGVLERVSVARDRSVVQAKRCLKYV